MGRARVRFSAEILATALPFVPASYRLVSAEPSRIEGEITLIFASDEVADGRVVDMSMSVSDVGSTRTAEMVRI